jgi:hypothetical protein
MSDLIVCGTCGRSHARDEIELVFRLPDAIFTLSEDERKERCDIGTDLCALDRRRFFVRGLLPLPVHGRAVPYRIGLWAEVDEDSFGMIYHLWDSQDQAKCPLLSGTLSNDLPLVPPTIALEVAIQLTGPTTRPDFLLRQTEHPLSLEQNLGIDPHRALEYTDRSRRGNAG